MKRIRLLVMDVDGVLTDGRIRLDARGREVKVFHAQDGFALVAWKQAGRRSAIVTGRVSAAVNHRARELQIDKVYQKAYCKKICLEKLMNTFSLQPREVCYIGDDWPDVGAFACVGLAVAVAQAPAEVKRQAHWVTRRSGGNGAVREVVERLLKVQGVWRTVVERYAD